MEKYGKGLFSVPLVNVREIVGGSGSATLELLYWSSVFLMRDRVLTVKTTEYDWRLDWYHPYIYMLLFIYILLLLKFNDIISGNLNFYVFYIIMNFTKRNNIFIYFKILSISTINLFLPFCGIYKNVLLNCW